jgi:hypothetical protein
MKVLAINNTRIKVGLSGGLTGEYMVVVEIQGKGFAKYLNDNSGKFSYINKIFQISPL